MPSSARESPSKAGAPIALVEPQMPGVHHAPFNAALLHAVALAFPDVPVSLQALPDHCAVVKTILGEHAPDLVSRITWKDLPPLTSGGIVTRWRTSARFLKQLFRSGNRILFCSISRMQLMQLKRIMRPQDVARAVLHGDLERLYTGENERFPMSLMALGRVLQMRTPPGLRLMLLGASVRDNVPPQFQQAFANAGIIDHPYHFPAEDSGAPLPDGPLLLGTFGSTGDGHLLEQVARAVREKTDQVRFRLVGYLSNQDAVRRLRPYVEDADTVHIPRSVFVERGHSLTHTLWLSSPNSFRLRASGTFFDALLYAKPLIYTANPYIDGYHAMQPEIGIRCATVDDVPAAILKLAAEHDATAYERARQAMLRFRQRFTPQMLATRLPAELNW